MIGWRSCRWAYCLVLSCALGFASTARANEFDQFQNARVAYESLSYDLAADLFEGLLKGASETDRRPLVIESRKYLAATYLFLNRRPDAEHQFEYLLRVEPDYVLDPLAFPEDVSKTFAAVKDRLAAERSVERERERQAEDKRVQRVVDDEHKRERDERLLQLARTERVEETRSRWVAALPFGIGQFHNDHDSLGIILAVSEGTLLVTSLVTYGLHESLRGLDPKPEDREDARLAEAGLRYANQISLGLFAAIALAGIVDAQVRFEPTRSFHRPRKLPPELDRVRLSVGPGALSLSGTF